MSLQTIDLKIAGMTCNHCKSFIINILSKSEGVREVEVSLETGKAHVSFDAAQTNAQDLAKTVNDSGIYTATIA